MKREVQAYNLHTPLALLQAFALVLIIIVSEYATRIFLAALLPQIGAFRVNDMLVSAVAYTLLVVLTAPPSRHLLAIIGQSLKEITAQARQQMTWVGVSAAFAVTWLQFIDQWLWGRVAIPEIHAKLTPIVLFPQAKLPLVIISVLLVNGIVIPLAEERLWRGLIQPRLIAWISIYPSIALTALLFSLKHAIIDASLARLLMLFAFGCVVGYIASRSSWKQSAFVHSTVNTLSTVILLVSQGTNI